MHRVLLLLVPLALSGCASTSLWEKTGTDQATLDLDLGKCRHDAQQEAMRLFASERTYPFYDTPFFTGGVPSLSWWLRRTVEKEQAGTERTLAAACMRKKGYEPVRA